MKSTRGLHGDAPAPFYHSPTIYYLSRMHHSIRTILMPHTRFSLSLCSKLMISILSTCLLQSSMMLTTEFGLPGHEYDLRYMPQPSSLYKHVSRLFGIRLSRCCCDLQYSNMRHVGSWADFDTGELSIPTSLPSCPNSKNSPFTQKTRKRQENNKIFSGFIRLPHNPHTK